ncbi:MAG: hypothetical protein ACI97A_000760 [Planctomycetota bacterium]
MKSKLSLILLAILSLGACGLESKEATKTPQGPAKPSADFVVQALVKGFAERSCEDIAQNAVGRLREYYETLAAMRDILADITGELTILYPDSHDAPTLVKMRDAWKAPIQGFKDLRVDGRLKSPDIETHRRYRISWEPKAGGREEDVLSLRLVDQRWRVDSLGAKSPNTEVVGGLKTQLNLLRFGYQDALKAVRDQKPVDIVAAQKLFAKIRLDLVEGG